MSLFCAGNQMHIPSINSKTIHKKDCPLPVLTGVGKPARTGSIPAELLFHSWCPSKCRFGVCPDAGVGWRHRFNTENLPHRIFSCPLADITKYFSQEAIDPLNIHGMKGALALFQEGVFNSQHNSSIFTQTNTCKKPNLMCV